MKKLTWQLILPLTIISLFTFTKWWFVQIDNDGSDFLSGFPLPYLCVGWHTSLSLQIFVSELIINFISHFAFWFCLVFTVNRYLIPIKISKAATVILVSFSILTATFAMSFALNTDNVYTLTREFDIKVIETGFKFFWE
jgi:hypothetical protein